MTNPTNQHTVPVAGYYSPTAASIASPGEDNKENISNCAHAQLNSSLTQSTKKAKREFSVLINDLPEEKQDSNPRPAKIAKRDPADQGNNSSPTFPIADEDIEKVSNCAQAQFNRPEQTSDFFQLPPEIIFSILQGLPSDALVNTLATCTALHAFEADPGLYKKKLLQLSLDRMVSLCQGIGMIDGKIQVPDRSAPLPDHLRLAVLKIVESEAAINRDSAYAIVSGLHAIDRGLAYCSIVPFIPLCAVGEQVGDPQEEEYIEQVAFFIEKATYSLGMFIDKERKDSVFSEIGEAYLKIIEKHAKDRIDLATKLIDVLKEAAWTNKEQFYHWKDKALFAVCTEQANETPLAALEMLDKISDPEDKDAALRKIFKVLTKQKDFKKAEAIINDFEDPYWQVVAYSKLGCLTYKNSSQEGLRLFLLAYDAADLIEDRMVQINALCQLGKAQAMTNPELSERSYQEMIEGAQNMGSPDDQKAYLCKIAKTQALSDLDAALRTLELVNDEERKYKALSRIAVTLAASNIRLALTICEQIPEKSGRRDWALLKIVTGLTAKDSKSAEEIADKIHNQEYKNEALSKIAIAQKDIEKRLDFIDSQENKVKILCQLAANEMDKMKAYSLLNKAFSIASNAQITSDEQMRFSGNGTQLVVVEEEYSHSEATMLKRIELLSLVRQTLARI